MSVTVFNNRDGMYTLQFTDALRKPVTISHEELTTIINCMNLVDCSISNYELHWLKSTFENVCCDLDSIRYNIEELAKKRSIIS